MHNDLEPGGMSAADIERGERVLASARHAARLLALAPVFAVYGAAWTVSALVALVCSGVQHGWRDARAFSNPPDAPPVPAFTEDDLRGGA